MSFEKLKYLILKGESETLEFKKSTGLIKAVFQTITGFLNHKGGTVLIGVLDNGKIVGQEITESTRQKIAKELPKIEPRAQVNIEYIPIEDTKQVIAITVLAGKHSPYAYDGRAYQRDLENTNRMPQHLYEQKLVARGQLNYSWESYLSAKYTLEDLDEDLIYEVVADGIRARRIPGSAIKDSKEEILSRFQLTEGSQIKNAALVLFCKKSCLSTAM